MVSYFNSVCFRKIQKIHAVFCYPYVVAGISVHCENNSEVPLEPLGDGGSWQYLIDSLYITAYRTSSGAVGQSC